MTPQGTQLLGASLLFVAALAVACVPYLEGTRVGDCDDGADNDGDGSYDCDDSGCAGSPLCEQAPPSDDDDSASPECAPCTGDFMVSNLADFSQLLWCSSISGSLMLDNLDPSVSSPPDLACLTRIEGNFDISNNAGLQNLDGFDNLEFVGQDLRLFVNAAIEHVDGLASLHTVGGNLAIDYSDSLLQVDGFAALTSIGADLHIYENPLVQNLAGFSSLVSIGNYFSIGECDLVTDLDGFAALTQVGGSMSINRNAALLNIDGLAGINSLGGTLSVSSNDSQVNVDGLSGISSIPGDLRLYFDSSLVDISGLANVTNVSGDLDVTSNAMLCQSHAEAMLSAAVVGGNTRISDNTGLCP